MPRATIFLSTRNRPNMVAKILENCQQFCKDHVIFIGNCCSTDRIEETSKVIRENKKDLEVKEFIYDPDPGCANCYSMLFSAVETELAIVWADDMLFLRNHDHLFNCFQDPMINLVALPMIDDITAAKSIPQGWPKDQFGCALWQTPTGRCSHHTIVRTSYFQKYGAVYTPQEYIDNFFHNHTIPMMRVWPSDGAYILHTRFDDETRLNMLIAPGIYRNKQ